MCNFELRNMKTKKRKGYLVFFLISLFFIIKGTTAALPYNLDTSSSAVSIFQYMDNESGTIPVWTISGTFISIDYKYNGTSGKSGNLTTGGALTPIPSSTLRASDKTSGNITYEMDVYMTSGMSGGEMGVYTGGALAAGGLTDISFNSRCANSWGYWSGSSNQCFSPNKDWVVDTWEHLKITCDTATKLCQIQFNNDGNWAYLPYRTDMWSTNGIYIYAVAGKSMLIDNFLVYNGTEPPTAAPETDPPYLNINNCAGETASPYKTSDTTPTCNISCLDDSECSMVRVMNKSTSFDLMTGTRNCSLDSGSTGTNTTWACTVIADDALISGIKTGQNIYFTGLDKLQNNNTEANQTAIMNITFVDTYVGLGDDISWIGFFPSSLDEDEIQPDGQTDIIPILNIQNNGTLDSAYLKISLNESLPNTIDYAEGVFYWKLENNTEAIAGNTLAEINNPSYHPGKVNYSANLTKTSSMYLYNNTLNGAQVNSIRTIDLWVKTDNIATQNTFIDFTNDDGDNTDMLMLDIDSGHIRAILVIGGSLKFNLAADIVQNDWTHIILVMGEDGAKLYVNGDTTPKDTSEDTSVLPATYTYIFVGVHDYHPIEYYLGGAIDNIYMTSQIYGAEEVTTAWNEGAGLDYSLIHPAYAMGANYWYNYSSAIALTDSQQDINNTAISEGGNVSVWLWANYTNPTEGYKGKLLFEYTTS